MSTVPSEMGRAANGTTGSMPYAEPAWKQELNDKLAAARARRQGTKQDVMPRQRPEAEADDAGGDTKSRASRVAAAVAARYAQAPTYSEYLASEVRAAMMAAVAAQAAANHARAAADAMLHELSEREAERNAPLAEQGFEPVREQGVDEGSTPAHVAAAERAATERSAKTKPVGPPRVDHAASGFQYAQPSAASSAATSPAPAEPSRAHAPTLHDPVQEALVTPSTPLPAKLLEFPRELIAARKARPRHAEGPLRDEGGERAGQLRIFEVEPSAISTRAEAPPQATEWSSIRLGAYPEDATGGAYAQQSAGGHVDGLQAPVNRRNYAPSQIGSSHHGSGASGLRASAYAHASRSQLVEHETLPGLAGIPDRLMAGIVDAALVGIAFALFALVFASSTAHPLIGKPAIIGGALLLTGLYLLYQFLFFTFSEATPGMRYARIALCTFDDDNPSRDAMRKRIFALVLAAAPLGLGFLYALFDEDHLGWHDRMTRMYQRSYK